MFMSVFLLAGCSFNNGPREVVDELFKKYQSLDDAVLSDLELTSESSMFTTSEQRSDYYKAMKKQYSDMKYEITDEVINGDSASVTVNISVYDYYKSQTESDDYLMSHQSEFTSDDVYDAAKYLSYKIKQLMDTSNRVEYTIKVNLTKEDNGWTVNDFDSITLQKIHGTYNYENN